MSRPEFWDESLYWAFVGSSLASFGWKFEDALRDADIRAALDRLAAALRASLEPPQC